MKFISGIILGVALTFGLAAHAGLIGSAIGGAAGASMATAGIEHKVDTINARIDSLTMVINSSKFCKQ